jgi:hypothetical protein
MDVHTLIDTLLAQLDARTVEALLRALDTEPEALTHYLAMAHREADSMPPSPSNLTGRVLLQHTLVHDLSEDDPAPDGSPHFVPTCRRPMHPGMLGTLDPRLVTCADCTALRPPECWR